MGLITLREFWFVLSRHDWTYKMSDSRRTYEQGYAQEQMIKTICDQSPRHKALYGEFAASVSCGSRRPRCPPLSRTVGRRRRSGRG